MDSHHDCEAEGAGLDAMGLGRRLEECRERLQRMVTVRLDPRLRGRVSPSDVVQESFADATLRFDEYRSSPRVPFHLWVRLLTGQKLLELERRHLGAQVRDAQRELPLGREAFPSASSETIASALLAKTSSPLHEAARHEVADRLRQALDRMSETDREVLVMRHFEHLSNNEVAAVLGLSKGGASLRYMRAARRLRGMLDSMGIEPSGTGE